MNDSVEMITVDATNVEQHGFFCYRSKPKSQGYQKKLDWLQQRFADGLIIKILREGNRSIGFIEYVPGEHTWRVVEAPNYLVIHCLWIGRAREKGYGSALIAACVEDAQQQGKHGVAMVTSKGNWLADDRIFMRNGFENLGSAPPSFNLLVKRLHAGPEPVFPQDWEKKLDQYPSGVTIVYADQCPYMPNVVQRAVDRFAARGIEAKVVKLETSAEVRAQSPTPYGVFGIAYEGKLLTYHLPGTKEMRRFEEFLRHSSSPASQSTY
jgi:L-amino acid N-acyltransferase YncA